MQIIYCCDPLNNRAPDSDYEAEAEAAQSSGFEYELISYEALVEQGDPQTAVKRVKEYSLSELAIYRGWMLKPAHYAQLYGELNRKGLTLINTPAQYLHCHYLPESYSIIETFTPKTIWLSIEVGLSMESITQALRVFGSKPVILKDYVKSRKHEWNEACYIPSASDPKSVEKVVTRFLELQGEDLAGGLVFREYVELEPLGIHPKSGMPLAKEFRLFFLDGELLCSFNYWAEAEYEEATLPFQHFTDIARNVQSRFFTMDVARQTDGKWIIIELGDGQVAGLPENADPLEFYRELASQRSRVENRLI